MKKDVSLSREILRATAKVSFISLLGGAISFLFIYFLNKDPLLSLVVAFSVGAILSLALSLTLSHKSAERISERVNKIDLSVPLQSDFYPELEDFRINLQEHNRRINEKLEEINVLHKEQDKMRRDFTANVSHELKTPLTSIKGYSELIRDGIAKPEDTPRFAEKIYDESQRLITLVGDIIKLSQLDENDIAVKIEKIDLNELTLAIIGHLEMAKKEKGVEITLTSDSDVFIMGAEQIVEEMIFNLIDNAIKYNKVGGKVKIKIRQRLDGVELEVSDTGIGIDEKDIPHIFERFWRADKSHSKEIGGTGLGLSIVKHGAMFMDAKVSVESTLRVGTTVRILF